MNYFLHSFKAIFIKDVVTELRAKQVLPTMVVLGMLIVWILRIVSEASSMNFAVMGPAALWIALLFSGLLAQERSFSVEQQNECIHALLLAPIDSGTIYLAKLLVNITMLCIFEIIIVPVVFIAFRLHIPDRWPVLICVLITTNTAISSVGTLFSAMVQLTRTRGALLSIIVLAILLPIMIPATFALLVLSGAIAPQQAGSGTLAMVGSFDAAIAFLIAFDAVFVVAGWLLFGFAIKE